MTWSYLFEQAIIEDLTQGRAVQWGFLGIEHRNISPELARAWNGDVNGDWHGPDDVPEQGHGHRAGARERGAEAHGQERRGRVARDLGRKRVIQRRFNVGVPRARVPKKDVHGRDRSER